MWFDSFSHTLLFLALSRLSSMDILHNIFSNDHHHEHVCGKEFKIYSWERVKHLIRDFDLDWDSFFCFSCSALPACCLPDKRDYFSSGKRWEREYREKISQHSSKRSKEDVTVNVIRVHEYWFRIYTFLYSLARLSSDILWNRASYPYNVWCDHLVRIHIHVFEFS